MKLGDGKDMTAEEWQDVDDVKLEDKTVYHSLSDIQSLSNELTDIFSAAWIQSVEQAVGFLSSVNSDVNGKDAFLAQARDVLGDEEYARYSKPCDSYQLGCDLCGTKEMTDIPEVIDAAVLEKEVSRVEDCCDQAKGDYDELNKK